MKTIDELNLIDWPLAVFDDVEYEETSLREYRILLRNRISHRPSIGYLKIWTIDDKGSSMLHFYDEDVLLGLLKLYIETYNNSIYMKIHNMTEFCKILGWAKGGYSNNKIIEALKRLTGLMFETDMWWDNKEYRYITRGFHIIDSYNIYKNKKGISSIGIKWSDTIFLSIKGKNVRPLNYDIYLSIKQPGARKLYRILDKRLYIKTKGQIPFEYLARNMLGIPQTKSRNYCEKIIKKYADELLNIGYLFRYKIEDYKDKYVFMFRRKTIEK